MGKKISKKDKEDWVASQIEMLQGILERHPLAAFIILYVYNNPNVTETAIWKGIQKEAAKTFKHVTQNDMFGALDYCDHIFLDFSGGPDIRRYYQVGCHTVTECLDYCERFIASIKKQKQAK